MISVLCKSDSRLHLAPGEKGSGVSSFTLCLERWTKREPCRADSIFCGECMEKYRQRQEQAKQKETLQLLEMTRSCQQGGAPDGWFYKGPADLLLREGKFFLRGERIYWPQSEPNACFRNAAMYACEHGLRYVEGYATSIIPVHHGWCIDKAGRVIEVTWDKLGMAYFGIEFRPLEVRHGSVLFHERHLAIYKRPLKQKLRYTTPHTDSA